MLVETKLTNAHPELSDEERNRRWRALRWRMDLAGLDCLLVWGNEGKWQSGLANNRYISGKPVPGIIMLPLEGDPVIWSGFPHDVTPWGALSGGWISDVRAGQGTTADVVKTLIDRKYDKGMIGIVGFGENRPRVIQETVPYTQFNRVKAGLPGATFVDATWIGEQTRLVKSAEEIALLRKSAELSYAMAKAMIDSAKPGVREYEVYANMLHACLVNGGEEDMVWLSSDAVPPPHGKRPPSSNRILNKGDILVCEYHGKYLGYLTGAELSVSIGQPAQLYRDLHKVCVESQKEGISKMQPGRPMSDAVEGFRRPIIEAGYGSVECGLHGHGLASPEFPSCMYGGVGGEWHNHPYARVPEIEFLPGMVFGTASDLHDPARNRNSGVMLGRTILITENGPEELTGIPLEADIYVV